MKNRNEVRRLLAMASIVAMSLGTLALAGCGDDGEAPPMEEPAQSEPAQPQQDPGTGQGGMNGEGPESGGTNQSGGN